MARDYYINGETMIYIKGAVDSAYPEVTELGLCEQPIRVSVEYRHLDIQVNAYGHVAPEKQAMGAMAKVYMSLVHFDPAVLRFLISQSVGGAPSPGTLGHAGNRMGNGVARYGPGWRYVGMSVVSALTAGDPNIVPWTFYCGVLANNPLEWPLGAERSVITATFDILPYSLDPWNGGNGSYGVRLWDHNPMT